MVEFVDNDEIEVMTVLEPRRLGERVPVRKAVIQERVEVMPPQYRHKMIKPQVPLEFWEIMHDFSMWLVIDDKHDLGHMSYHNRSWHFYRNKRSPHHPSPLHHYQIGIMGMFISQMGALVTKAIDIKNAFEDDEEPINITPRKTTPALHRPRKKRFTAGC